jgi:hypothetical protein
MSFPDHEDLPDKSAQDVVDAIRFVLMAQTDHKEQMALVTALLDIAPETDSNGGFELLTELLAEGSLKVSVV